MGRYAILDSKKFSYPQGLNKKCGNLMELMNIIKKRDQLEEGFN